MTMNVDPSCPFSYVTFAAPPIQNHSRFLDFPNKILKIEPKITQKHDKHGICDTFAKRPHQKTRILFTKTTQNSRFQAFDKKNLQRINDTPRAAADARAALFSTLGKGVDHGGKGEARPTVS